MNLKCHCGKIGLEVNNKPSTLTSCNCSICIRYGSLWGYYSPSDVTVKADPEDIKSYKWSEETIEFKHCNNCGCITHYETTGKVKDKNVVVNFRMADPEKIQGIKIRKFDGADTWKFLN